MPDAVAAQDAAIHAVLEAYHRSVQAANPVAAQRDPTPDNADFVASYRTWRAAVRGVCEAAHALVGTCGTDGPDPRVWTGATPPRELWSAARETAHADFWTRLHNWDTQSTAALSGDPDARPETDPAAAILAACSRAQDYLAEKQHDAMIEAAEGLQNGPRPVSVESSVTPGGGRITSVTLGPLPSTLPTERPDGSSRLRIRPRWWTTRQEHRARARRDRPAYRFGRRLLHGSPHDSALALALRGWLQLAEPDTVMTQSWYICYYLTAVMTGLGYRTTMTAVDIEFRHTAPQSDDLSGWGRPADDPFSPPNAVVLLPETSQLLDPLAGHPFFDTGREPILISAQLPAAPGDTFTTAVADNTQLTYTISDHRPADNPHHASSCAAIDDIVARNLPMPVWDDYRARPSRRAD